MCLFVNNNLTVKFLLLYFNKINTSDEVYKKIAALHRKDIICNYNNFTDTCTVAPSYLHTKSSMVTTRIMTMKTMMTPTMAGTWLDVGAAVNTLRAGTKHISVS